MIPSIFQGGSRELDISEAERRRWAQARSAALLAFDELGGAGVNAGATVIIALR